LKLIDAVVPRPSCSKSAKDWIKAGGTAKAPWDREDFSAARRAGLFKAGMMTFPAANAIYRARDLRQYIRPRVPLLQTVYEGLQLPMGSGAARGSRWFAEDPALADRRRHDPIAVRSLQELNKGARRPKQVPPTRSRPSASSGRLQWARHRLCDGARRHHVVLIDRDQSAADRGKGAFAKA